MLETGEAWFVVVDGRKARIFSQIRRGASLSRLADGEMELSEDEKIQPQDKAPRTFESGANARHAVNERDYHQEEEDRFIARVAERLDYAAQHDAFAHLVVAAPPKALGVLREKMRSASQAKLRAEIPKDVLREPEAALQDRFSEALRAVN